MPEALKIPFMTSANATMAVVEFVRPVNAWKTLFNQTRQRCLDEFLLSLFHVWYVREALGNAEGETAGL